ncbi:CLUMA_CG009195, isoform A [Clunio marinus]|uniref:Flavin-containing monooxygenase n=1 Tax=Clunio marinus TaxID=568069 RepID=A0A1J1I7M5_9DIPT|nr:CLUMA_CG009195, isoform A [Clunio marinus]
MKIAVIGAGAAGLAAIKNSINYGCDVICFEQSDKVGGTWVYTDEIGVNKFNLDVHSSMYKNLVTNLPIELMCYPNEKFPENEQSFVTSEVVLDYYEHYADKYNLRDNIKFEHHVLSVRPIKDETWEVIVNNLSRSTHETYIFDAILVCSGHFHSCHIPKYGSNFKGHQIHSHHYRTAEKFENEAVLIIGGNFSAVDIVQQTAKYAKSILWSHHNKTEPDITAFGTNVRQKPDVRKFNEDCLEFIDGSVEKITWIIYCTGYEFKFPFLSVDCGINTTDDYVKPLFKHCLNINRPTMAFIGLPNLICPNQLFDLQSRFALTFITKRRNLPSRDDMIKDQELDLSSRWKRGLPLKKAHLMGPDVQHEYYVDLATTADIKPIMPVIAKMHKFTNINHTMLSKLNINNFMCLSNIEVDFNHNFTSINGKPGLTKGLSSLIEAIRFVLECSELDFNEICSSTNYQEDNPSVYVEATISDPFGRSNIFRKSIFDHTIVYHIDGNVSNQLEFKRLLLSSQVVQPLMSTFIIDSQMIDMVTVLRDGKRTNLIETFCYDDKDEIISNYNRMFQFIDDAKHDMNMNLKKQRALNAEKRKIHKKNESNKRRSQLVKEFDGKSIQFNLFKIFHNAKFLESVENFNHDEQLLIEDFESSIVEQDDILIHSYHNKNIATEEIKQMNQQIEELNEDFIKSKELHNQNKIIDNVQSNLKRYLETIKEDIAKRIRSIRCDIEQLDLENALWELELKTRKTVACEAEMEELQDDLKSSFHTLNNLENKFYPLNEKLNELKTVLMEKLQKKKQLESFLVPKLQSISPESSVNNIKARENILKDLKENFSSRIIGRLSQLWPTSGETDADHCNVFKRLGEFSETIIVDTKETALECISYLKLKQLSDINEAFLPLNELSDQKTSNDFLPAGELPPYCEIVEKLIKVSNEELMRSFIYFLKPSLICGSLNESETLITWDGICLKENYEIIVKNFMDYNSISLVNGLMENVIVTPDDLPDNVSLIQEQLKRLEVNFESLHQNLKGNVNVVEKSREFLIALDTLSQQIEKERGKIGKDVSQTRIKRINSDLAAISQKVALQKKNVGSVKEKFEEVAVERKERFVKCLNALNNGIGECCQQMFDGNVIANLKVAKNNDEPYLGDTIFTWYTISNSPKILTELDKNYDAALAFIFAIVKMKGHKLIILNDISGKISKHAKKFIHLQNDYQIISISSRRSDMDTSNFLLHPDSKSNLFTIKRCR